MDIDLIVYTSALIVFIVFIALQEYKRRRDEEKISRWMKESLYPHLENSYMNYKAKYHSQ